MVRIIIHIDDKESLEALAEEIKERCDYDITREEVLRILPDYFRALAEQVVEDGLENGLSDLNVSVFEKILRKSKSLS